MAKVIWTESALTDLDEIGDYISQDSFKYAQITVSKLFEATDILANNPKAGAIAPEINNELIRQLIRGSYRIIYHLVNKERIDILTVHRSSMLLENTFDFEKFKED